MTDNSIITSNPRFERKFSNAILSTHEVERLVRLHPAIFNEIYSYRGVNNIYFDSFNYNNYNDNIEGVSDRIKIRIRWYGNLFGKIEKPVLEIKIKNGLLGKKKSIKIRDFELNNRTDISQIIEQINVENTFVNIDFKSLKPTLLNRYTRKYFQSVDKKYRITIDYKQEFYQIKSKHNSFLNVRKNDRSVIIELKYDEKYDEDVSFITSNFPFRLSKSSKYVDGLQRLNLAE